MSILPEPLIDPTTDPPGTFTNVIPREFDPGKQTCPGELAQRNRLPYAGHDRASKCGLDRKSTRLNSSHGYISYAVFCLKKKKNSSSVSVSTTTKSSVLQSLTSACS